MKKHVEGVLKTEVLIVLTSSVVKMFKNTHRIRKVKSYSCDDYSLNIGLVWYLAYDYYTISSVIIFIYFVHHRINSLADSP